MSRDTTFDQPEFAGHTYVINQDYRVVYLDKNARHLFPAGRVGSLCYECFRGEHQPCEDCPCIREAGEHAKRTVIYSARLDRWYEIVTLDLEWFDEGRCTLVSGHPIENLGRNLATALQTTESYDELYEINVTDNSYRMLYNEPEKYTLRTREGALDSLFEEVAQFLIHPDDRERFRLFWNLDTLTERLDQAQGPMVAEFRKLKQDGSWGWVVQNVVPVKRGNTGDIVAMCFTTDIDEEMHRRETHAENSQMRLLRERDQLTGLYNALTFYDKAEELLERRGKRPHEAVYLDIEHFKVYNEWHGREAGDRILLNIAEAFTQSANDFNGVAGYLGGDDFVLLVPSGTVTESYVDHMLEQAQTTNADIIGLQLAIGISPVEWPTISAVTACDHAMVAMNSVKGSYEKRLAWYDSTMSEELETETKILAEVKQALKNKEFVLYWQPQCSTRTGRIVGFEALVRWQHPREGLVMPGAFIPVLERNGFIASLDLYVWDEACRQLRSWIDEGKTPLPISVNISRADLYAIDVVETLSELTTRYQIDKRLLELEITESAYAEDNKMAQAVNQLKELGFTILMDDFGNGYSSLNMLKDINVDILKLDMGFMTQGENTKRSESILEAIVSMTRLMELRIIAEGVETEEQVAFLRNIGCDYAQGYYFYRPMSTAAIEELVADESLLDFRGVLSPQVEMIDIDVLVHKDTTSRAIIDNLIGGMAMYAVYDDHFELQQANNEYYNVTGCDPQDLKERQSVIWKQVHPDDLHIINALFDEAEQHPISGANGVIRRYRPTGEVMWMKFRMFFLSRQENRRIFYAAVEDVTANYC